MRCPRCQHENPRGQKFCGECGTPLTVASSTARSYADLKSQVERLGGELTESLEQQTATREILRVIASSPTDLQPVMDTVAENAARLCGATDSAIFRVDGDGLRLVPVRANCRVSCGRRSRSRSRPTRSVGRAVAERRTIHVADLHALSETEFPETRARRGGVRSQGLGRTWPRRSCVRECRSEPS